jgi:hypothetical protein
LLVAVCFRLGWRVLKALLAVGSRCGVLSG